MRQTHRYVGTTPRIVKVCGLPMVSLISDSLKSRIEDWIFPNSIEIEHFMLCIYICFGCLPYMNAIFGLQSDNKLRLHQSIRRRTYRMAKRGCDRIMSQHGSFTCFISPYSMCVCGVANALTIQDAASLQTSIFLCPWNPQRCVYKHRLHQLYKIQITFWVHMDAQRSARDSNRHSNFDMLWHSWEIQPSVSTTGRFVKS